MKIASWNVNSIRQRTPHVLRWLDKNAPDILCLQELKGVEFPKDAFQAAGYHSVYASEKAYNGVAILSRTPVALVLDRLPGDNADLQARYLEVEGDGIRILNIYLPNGNPAPGEKFDYKLRWMDRLYARAKTLRDSGIPFLIAGDFNVIPHARDCYNPSAWADDALFRVESRGAFRALLHLGLTDAFRVHETGAGHYTFWDYQAGCWPADKGIRIDHILLSPTLTDRMDRCVIDPGPRGEEQPSDHTPIWVEIGA